MKVRELLALLREDGWVEQPGKGTGSSHRHFRHPTKPGLITIAFHGANREVPKGTLNDILKMAGLKGPKEQRS